MGHALTDTHGYTISNQSAGITVERKASKPRQRTNDNAKKVGCNTQERAKRFEKPAGMGACTYRQESTRADPLTLLSVSLSSSSI